jgi:hypothetical protein
VTNLYANQKETNIGFGSVKKRNENPAEFQFARGLGYGPSHEDYSAYVADLQGAAKMEQK